MGDDEDLQGSVFALLRHRNAQSLKQGNRENNLERSQLRLLDGPNCPRAGQTRLSGARSSNSRNEEIGE